MSWHSLLVLGGIGSGRLEYAESLLGSTEPVERVTGGAGADLARLSQLLSDPKPDRTLLVSDLSEWMTGDPDPLARAVAGSPARVVLVSPEVGLALPPSIEAAGAPTGDPVRDLGELNRTLAGAVDAVVLVVAGQPLWLKGAGAGPRGAGPAPVQTAPKPEESDLAPDLTTIRRLPLPDEPARVGATERLLTAPAGRLGRLETVVTFAAGALADPVPAPWDRVRVLVLRGDHLGGASAGAGESAGRAAALRDGSAPLATLAGSAGAQVRVVEVAAADPIEDGPAMTDQAVEAALGYGWRLAEQAADEGVNAVVIGSIGAGAETAAAAVVAALAANAEPAVLLPRVRDGDGRFDDHAWIARCAAVRDAVHRCRAAGRATAKPVLAELGGPDLATATGLILGAAARRTPVLVDGPVGTAAAVVARGIAAPVRHWLLLPDHGQHPTAVRASDVVGLEPLLDLRLEVGEGAGSCAALPLLRSALSLASTVAHTNPIGRDLPVS